MTPETKQKVQHLAIFWARLIGWLGFGTVAPIAIFAVKFGLFKREPSTVVDELGNVIEQPSLSLNGWGIVSCIIIGLTLTCILKEIIGAYPTYTMAKQCLTGIMHIILPLAITFTICFFLKGVLKQIEFCVATIILCQAVAIPMNPLPQWRYATAGDEIYSALDIIQKMRNSHADKE